MTDNSLEGGQGTITGEPHTVSSRWVSYEQKLELPDTTNAGNPLTFVRLLLGVGAELGDMCIDDVSFALDIIDNDGDLIPQELDCNDNDASINPFTAEIPDNNIDENCDGVILYLDKDGDGFTSDVDCDDNNPATNPDAEEIRNNNIDENCDGIVLIIDEDNDGANSDEDCDDNDPTLSPNLPEIANNDIDENCDGIVLIIDEDNDGFNSDEDCDDNDARVYPDAEEIRNNHIDENCDGVDDTVFDDYPWLEELVNRNSCEGVIIEIYLSEEGVYFIYVIRGPSKRLYYADGSIACITFPNLDCIEFCKLFPTDLVETWSCPTNGNFVENPTINQLETKIATLSTQINIFPTLANETINIAYNQKAKIRLVSLGGQIVRSLDHSAGLSTIDVSDLEEGYYMIQVEGVYTTKSFKVIIAH